MLGMKLADVTPELQAAYDLYHPQGAVVLDPGPNAPRLGLGELAEGCYFWLVGDDTQPATVREFVDAILNARNLAAKDVFQLRPPE